ncbi:MAG: phosphoenolpyruvate--protein phosphotransferase [Actinobacteria bacterium]|nr:phosphoenolpyruvate--protein phosphotransferase [Actinomycetota bacterium]
MVGLVVVSHSARLAEGVVELAAQMAGSEVRIGAAGGLDEPGDALGTDATRVLTAIKDVWSGDGVLVLMDLGSAVLSAELAVDLLEAEQRDKVLLTEAPLVEGAVAAGVAAALGEPLESVAAAARAGLEGKTAQLVPGDREGAPAGAGHDRAAPAGDQALAPSGETIRLTVRTPLGIHARPAALLVRTAAEYDAVVTVANGTLGRGPVSARSLTGVATLGVGLGDELVVTAHGPQASQALDAIRRLAEDSFGDPRPDSASDEATERIGLRPAEDRRETRDETDDDAATATAEPPPAGAVLTGIAASPGVAAGPACRLHRAVPGPLDAPAEDPSTEWAALQSALRAAAGEVERSRASLALRTREHDAAILDAHLLLLDDEALLEAAREAVLTRGEPAARAWAEAVNAAARDWEALEDPYQRARAEDLRDLGARVLRHLAGSEATGDPSPEGILVAQDLSPADVADLDTARTAGIALAGGSATSHAAILARALGVPVVAGAGAALLAVADGTPLAVDGDAGTVTVAPSPERLAAVARRREEQAGEAAAAQAAAGGPAVTRDGLAVAVEANIGGPHDVPAAVAAGADGVGLLRTEFLFQGAASMPDEGEQAAAYAAVADALGGRPLTVRTLDAGADKPLPYLAVPPEANPFLGLRGLRLSLARPGQLGRQLRAILRAAAGRTIRVMFPMVADVDELRRALAVLDEARASLTDEGVPVPAHLETGIMLEVPAAALLAEKLAPLVDFFSVGTNDLTQYTLAAERGNAGVAALFDPLHPAVLGLIARASAAATATGRRLAVCGEVAGDRLAVPLLVGLGVSELSMNPVAIPAAKQAVRATDAGEAAALAREALSAESAAAVRRLLAAAAG